jgi:predicted aspartyl protease
MHDFIAGSMFVAAAVLSSSVPAQADCQLNPLQAVQLRATPSGLLAAPARIRATQTWLVVDTGGSFSTLNPDFASAAGLTVKESRRREIGTFFDGMVAKAHATVADFALADLAMPKTTFAVIGIGITDPTVGGTISEDVLSQFDFSIDPRRAVMLIFAPSHCDGSRPQIVDSGFAAVPIIESRGNHILVSVTLDGHSFNAVIDTGSPSSYLSGDAARAWLSDSSQGLRSPGEHEFSNLALGNAAFQSVRLTVTDKEVVAPSILLGMDFLRRTRFFALLNDRMLFIQGQ